MAEAGQKVLKFGAFTLDPNAASLCDAEGQRALRAKSLDVLLYLVRHPGRIVTKDELIEAIWPNVFVTENSLVQCISDIRAALRDDGQAILKTVARRGYLFAAPVVEAEPSSAQVIALAPTSPREPIQVNAVPAVDVDRPAATRPRHRQMAAAVLVAALVAVAAAVTGTALWWTQTPGSVAQSDARAPDPPAATKRIAIAVLPLTTLGAPVTDEYFADGLTEDIIAALGRFSDLSVASPRAVASHKGKTARLEDIGRELKVRYIAEGSVRRTPDRIRIAMRLTDASLGTLLWADQFDAELTDIFAIQDNITRQITGALAVRLTSVEQARIAAKPPASLEAYDLVLRGRDLLARLSRVATSNARTAFERAMELDPNYGAAYIGLGRVDLIAVHLGWTPDPAGVLRRAESRARKAIEIDEFNPAALALLGRVSTRLGEYDLAVDLLRRAMKLNPSDPDNYAGLGDALLWNGDVAGAIAALETAAQLDPRLSSEDLFNLGAGYFLAGDHAKAAHVFERTVARNDGNPFIHAMLAAIYAEAGRPDPSIRAAEEVRRRNPFFDRASFGSLFRNPGHRQKILSALEKAGL
jgi:adenylate cyclase